jgi:hypothetical protein
MTAANVGVKRTDLQMNGEEAISRGPKGVIGSTVGSDGDVDTADT